VREIKNTPEFYFTAKISCNMCEGVVWSSAVSTAKTPPYFKSLVTWGKKSRWEGEEHEFHLCEQCYSELVGSFKLPLTDKEGRLRRHV
jgi:hypothetical protein